MNMCWSRRKDGQGPICLVSPCGDILSLRGVVAAQRPLRSQKEQTITHMEQCMALEARCGDMASKMRGRKYVRVIRRGARGGVIWVGFLMIFPHFRPLDDPLCIKKPQKSLLTRS